MRNGSQDHLSGLAAYRPRAERRAEPSRFDPTFQHRVDGLDLPALPISGLEPREPLLDYSPPSAGRRLSRWPASFRRDDRPDAVRADRDVQRFRDVVGISQEHLDPRPSRRLSERPSKLHQVGPLAAARHRSVGRVMRHHLRRKYELTPIAYELTTIACISTEAEQCQIYFLSFSSSVIASEVWSQCFMVVGDS